MFITTTPEEQIVVDVLRGKEMLHADELMLQTKLTNSQLAAVLLQLEMMNVVKSLPGKCYRLR
jgi:DNA processing protein